MKNILFIILLLLFVNVSYGQQLEKVIFRTMTSKTYDSSIQKPKKVNAQEYKSLIILKEKEVRTNDKGVGSSFNDDLSYEVTKVFTERKEVYVWDCTDRTFELDIKKMLVILKFKKSNIFIIYTGYFI